MKKLLLVFMVLIMLTGCGSSQNNAYTGKKTDLSSKYLSKGYLVNVYRSSTPLSDDLEDYGKAYVTMTFNVITEITSTVSYNDTNDYIKKKVISNIRLIKTPKMGMSEEIYADYGTYGKNVELKGSNNKYTKVYDTPVYYPDQTSLGVKINRIALLDSSRYNADEQPSLSQIYSDLGITRDNVALTLGFRIELTTVSDKILYKDYEVEMPPKGFAISGSEFQVNFMTDDISKMESFLEKE